MGFETINAPITGTDASTATTRTPPDAHSGLRSAGVARRLGATRRGLGRHLLADRASSVAPSTSWTPARASLPLPQHQRPIAKQWPPRRPLRVCPTLGRVKTMLTPQAPFLMPQPGVQPRYVPLVTVLLREPLRPEQPASLSTSLRYSMTLYPHLQLLHKPLGTQRSLILKRPPLPSRSARSLRRHPPTVASARLQRSIWATGYTWSAGDLFRSPSHGRAQLSSLPSSGAFRTSFPRR